MKYSQDINKSVTILRNGGIILYPTDTIWGLGCDATNINAVEKIYQIKKREKSKGLIILIDSVENLSNYVLKIPEKAIKLTRNNKKPITIIYPKATKIAKNALAKNGTVAVRIPKDDFCLDMLKKFGKPLISTSANISTEQPPQNFSQISEDIIRKVDYTVKWRQNEISKSKASSIVIFNDNGEMKYLRK